MKDTDKKINQIKNFQKRWKLELNEDEKANDFKNRVLNSFAKLLEWKVIHNKEVEPEFLEIVGMHNKKTTTSLEIMGFDRTLSDTQTYNFFLYQTDIRKFIFGIQAIFMLESISDDLKCNFYKELRGIVNLTGFQIEFKKVKNDIIIYPKGAKSLDEKLVNDVLDWLEEYPKVYEKYKLALSYIGIKGKERIVLDNLRFSLEQLLKNIFGNRKSLENQKKELGEFIKSHINSREISNLFWKVYDFYITYQNENVKHNENISENEVEFMLYQTGILIKVIIDTSKTE